MEKYQNIELKCVYYSQCNTIPIFITFILFLRAQQNIISQAESPMKIAKKFELHFHISTVSYDKMKNVNNIVSSQKDSHYNPSYFIKIYQCQCEPAFIFATC